MISLAHELFMSEHYTLTLSGTCFWYSLLSVEDFNRKICVRNGHKASNSHIVSKAEELLMKDSLDISAFLQVKMSI